MTDNAQYSQWLLSHPELSGRSKALLPRVGLAKKRIQSILDRDTIANQRTLEQKISDQGPSGQRVDPHLVGYAVKDLLELNRLQKILHKKTNTHWYANPATKPEHYDPKLQKLAPLYAAITGGGFGNLSGDALEIAVFRCLDAAFDANPRHTYHGSFYLDKPKNKEGRFDKIKPPQNIGKYVTKKSPDFLQYGHAPGPLCIECKNYREWAYPRESYIKDLIVRASELNAIPVLIARRIQYATITNLLVPAGIIAHESYYQYYPSDKSALAESVRDKRSLGFTDVLASETPHARTLKFFLQDIPRVVDASAARWLANKPHLLDYATDKINLAQLYTAINSPAGGKWLEREPDVDSEIIF
jgi:hypothetical protein